MTTPRRVLLTNITLNGRSGTESVTRDLALALLRNGEQPFVYSPHIGQIAEEIRDFGVPVTDDIAKVALEPDVVHAHHLPTCATALARFPFTPAIFVCHDFRFWHDLPPKLPSLRRYAAVSEGFLTRLTVGAGVDPRLCRVILNGTDMDRFRRGPELPTRPRRALAFAKNPEHLDAVRQVCAERGLELEIVGHFGQRVEERPQDLIPTYDVVFTSALTAIEAMACGRAVVACDGRGLAGMVDTERYDRWRPENFGLRTFDQPLTVGNLHRELDRYDPAAAEAVTVRIREEAGLGPWARSYAELYSEAQSDALARPTSLAETSFALASHLQTWSPGYQREWPWMLEREQLIHDLRQAELGSRPIDLGTPVFAGDADRVRLEGFHDVEEWGVWSSSAFCSVGVVLPDGARPQSVELTFNTCGDEPFRIEVFANGLPVGLTVDANRLGGPWRLALPDLRNGGLLWLSFRTSEPRAPSEISDSLDTRRLGLGLSRLVFLSGDAGSAAATVAETGA